VRWVSEGMGDFEVGNMDGLERGTKIVLRLRKDCIKFSREQEVEKVIKKYSIFNKFPICINGHELSDMQAIWYKGPREVTEEEHARFYERLVDTKIPHKYRLHYSTEVPLAIRSIFYVGSTHAEKVQGQSEALKLHLYSRKVLIKESCKELIPNYLRFVKGVVDCEDLPLNISRETY
jgi:TNF receptor-associated protein 1